VRLNQVVLPIKKSLSVKLILFHKQLTLFNKEYFNKCVIFKKFKIKN